jgi:hypothetical protein
MKTALLAFAILLSPGAHAAPLAGSPNTLFILSSDVDSDLTTFSVDIAGGAVAGFEATSGSDSAIASFAAADVAKPEGVVVHSFHGHDVLFLQGAVDGKSGEGTFHLKYLSNGLTRSFAPCDFLLKKSGSNYFAQNASTGDHITNPKILTWSLGISTLQGICQ